MLDKHNRKEKPVRVQTSRERVTLILVGKHQKYGRQRTAAGTRTIHRVCNRQEAEAIYLHSDNNYNPPYISIMWDAYVPGDHRVSQRDQEGSADQCITLVLASLC